MKDWRPLPGRCREKDYGSKILLSCSWEGLLKLINGQYRPFSSIVCLYEMPVGHRAFYWDSSL